MKNQDWKNIINEGGEGFVPSTKSEMTQIEAELATLNARKAMTQVQKDAEANQRQNEYLAKEKASDWN